MTDQELLESSALFDAAWYRHRYPDVQALSLTPAQHFLKYGWRMNRSPGPGFSTPAYLEQYPDIRKANINPVLHYLRHGKTEGRRALPVSDPSAVVMDPHSSFPEATSLSLEYDTKSNNDELELAIKQTKLKEKIEKIEELEEENRMLLEQLHIVQEELERSILSGKEKE